MSATFSYFIHLQKTNETIHQKLIALELEQSALRLFGDDQSCECIFAGLEWPSTISANSAIPMTKLNNGCAPSTPPIVEKGKAIRNGTKMVINKIELKNLTPISADKVSADLEIGFDPESLTGPLKNISMPGQQFLITAGKITTCLGGSISPAKTCTSLGGQWKSEKCSFGSIALASAPTPSPGPTDTPSVTVSANKSNVAVGEFYDICWSSTQATSCRGPSGVSLGTSGCKSGSMLTPGTYPFPITCLSASGISATGSTTVTVSGTQVPTSGACVSNIGVLCTMQSGVNGNIKCDGTCAP